MFDNLEQVFKAIESCQYVVLRNYESFFTEDFLNDHPDIDMLTSQKEELVTRLALQTRKRKDDGVHYCVVVDGKKVAVDIREVGDGYLDKSWEQDILDTSVLEESVHVPNAEHYFYSLLYHATVQKKAVAEDYKLRLDQMGKVQRSEWNWDLHWDFLEQFMRDRGYRYTYPQSSGTLFEIKNASPDLVERDAVKKMKRRCYQIAKKMKQFIRR